MNAWPRRSSPNDPLREDRGRASLLERWLPQAGALLSLGFPIAVAVIGKAVMGLSDIALVSGLGVDALAGVGLAVVLTHLFFAAVFGWMRGVKVCVARGVGTARLSASPSNRSKGSAFAVAGAAIGLAMSVLFLVAAQHAGEALSLAGIHPSSVPSAVAFVDGRAWGAPLAFAAAALIQHRHGVGDTRRPMFISIAANVVNVAASLALSRGLLGQPLGVYGVGVGTAVAETFEALLLIGLLVRERPAISFQSVLAAAGPLTRIGLPIGLSFASEMLAFTVMTGILGRLSSLEVAAHYVALNLVRFAILPVFGIAEATTVLVGQALGAMRPRLALETIRTSFVLATLMAALLGVCVASMGGPIARLLSFDSSALERAQTLLWVAVLFLTMDAGVLVMRGALRAAGDVRWPSAALSVMAWICLPGGALLLGVWSGWGAIGAWCGFVVETLLGLSFLVWRFRSRIPRPTTSPAAWRRFAALA